MMDSNYLRDLHGMRGPDFIEGFKEGIKAYAYWKDSIQYVGTSGKTLKEALEEVDTAFDEGVKK